MIEYKICKMCDEYLAPSNSTNGCCSIKCARDFSDLKNDLKNNRDKPVVRLIKVMRQDEKNDRWTMLSWETPFLWLSKYNLTKEFANTDYFRLSDKFYELFGEFLNDV